MKSEWGSDVRRIREPRVDRKESQLAKLDDKGRPFGAALFERRIRGDAFSKPIGFVVFTVAAKSFASKPVVDSRFGANGRGSEFVVGAIAPCLKPVPQRVGARAVSP